MNYLQEFWNKIVDYRTTHLRGFRFTGTGLKTALTASSKT